MQKVVFTHDLSLTSEVFLTLIFLVGCDARFWDPAQDALENVWFLLF